MPRKKKEETFETAAGRLEQIVDSISGGEMPLHDTVSLYKEGLTLAAFCVEALNKTEQEVNELRKTADGVFELVKLDNLIDKGI